MRMGWTMAGAVAGLAAMLGAAPAAAVPAKAPIEVLVVGTYHFDNPGLDLNNLKTEDVLTPVRQAELERLERVLADYRPTKIMVEHSAPDLVDTGYPAFTDAMLARERGEAVQIGYRLARRLGHKTVYAIDAKAGPGEPDDFPFDAVMAFAKAKGQMPRLQAEMDRAAAETKANEARQASESIPSLLISYNDPKSYLTGISGYYGMLAVGDAGRQPGADLNGAWYARNARIFAKLMQAAEPGDRVLVVYGAGHGYWLRHFASETPGYRSIDVLPYLRRAAR